MSDQMNRWPRGESPTGRGYVGGCSDLSQYQADIAQMEREDERRARERRLAEEGRPVSMSDHEALALILHSAQEASKVYPASGNLELIIQTCKQQLRLR